jgi:uncharacterized membrane protein
MENDLTLSRKIVISIYILYLAAALMPPLAIIAVIVAYIFEGDATDFLVSHYLYLIRTFWIGLLFFGISALLFPVLIGILFWLLSAIWWLIRVAKGLKATLQFKPIIRPKTWKF